MSTLPLTEQIKQAILAQMPDAVVEVDGGGGHFNIQVTSTQFAGKNMLEQQRLVYKAITPLMAGNNAPLHAVDSLKCRVPQP